MTTLTITNDQLVKIIKNAFKDGEQWGVTYSTWFTPTEIQSDEKIAESMVRASAILMGKEQ